MDDERCKVQKTLHKANESRRSFMKNNQLFNDKKETNQPKARLG